MASLRHIARRHDKVQANPHGLGERAYKKFGKKLFTVEGYFSDTHHPIIIKDLEGNEWRSRPGDIIPYK